MILFIDITMREYTLQIGYVTPHEYYLKNLTCVKI